MVIIENFNKGSAEFSGSDWYSNYIEPYIRSTGISVVGVLGSCLDSEQVYGFWKEQGFQGPSLIHDEFRSLRFVINYSLVLKKLD
jgi:hypothetical protein